MKTSAKSNKIAFIGVSSALSCSIMIFFSMAALGFGTLAVPIISVIALLPVLFEYGRSSALAAYFVTLLLSLLLCPDKEPVFVFMFFGWHPVVAKTLEGLPAAVKTSIMLLLFASTASVMILFMISVMGIDYSFFMKTRFILYSSAAMSAVVYLMLGKTFSEMQKMWEGGLADRFRKR